MIAGAIGTTGIEQFKGGGYVVGYSVVPVFENWGDWDHWSDDSA